MQRLTARIRELLRSGRGHSLTQTIETLNPLLRGWITYFQTHANAGCVGGPRRMGTATAALPSVAAVEANPDSGA